MQSICKFLSKYLFYFSDSSIYLWNNIMHHVLQINNQWLATCDNYIRSLWIVCNS